MTERARLSWHRAVVAAALAWLAGSVLVPPLRWWIAHAPGEPGPLGDPEFQFWFWPFWSVMAGMWSALPVLFLGPALLALLVPRMVERVPATLAIGALIGAAIVAAAATGAGLAWRAGGAEAGALYGGLVGAFGAGLARA